MKAYCLPSHMFPHYVAKVQPYSCHLHIHISKNNMLNVRRRTFYTFYSFIMRPSSLGGGRILRRTLSVRLSVCLSVCPVIITERHVTPPSELK